MAEWWLSIICMATIWSVCSRDLLGRPFESFFRFHMTFYKECPKRHVELIKIGYVNVFVIFQYPFFKRWMFRFKRVLHLEHGPHKTVRRTRQLRSWGARHAKKMKNMPRAINESLWASTSVSKVIKRLQWNYHVVQTTCANSIKWQCRRVLYGGPKLRRNLNSLWR